MSAHADGGETEAGHDGIEPVTAATAPEVARQGAGIEEGVVAHRQAMAFAAGAQEGQVEAAAVVGDEQGTFAGEATEGA